MKLMFKAAMAFVVIASFAISGCKTSEENYKAAYEIARQKKEEASGVGSDVYDKMKKEAIDTRLIVDGDSLPMNTVNVKVAAQSIDPAEVKQYNIVVNGFKQVFNAKSQMTRLKAAGYTGAFLLENADALYYVVAGSYTTAEEATAAYNDIVKDRNVVVKAPYPWILRPARFPVR